MEKALEYFESINAIPRCSKNEVAVRLWLQEWAAARNFQAQADTAGNLVIRVPASQGSEGEPTIVLQAHTDMVCEKTPDSPHDFSKDPIVSKRDGDWLSADRTTLGADNGIGLALALALGEDRSLRHPPLELLFTVDEETGLNGVKAMARDLISGKMLINLDSEDEGVFTIGCAGGMDTTLGMTFQPSAAPSGWLAQKLVVGGLRGGHSGIDIQKHRGNAIKLLARVLAQVCTVCACRLGSLKGGTRHNAIPRDAEAAIFYPAEAHQAVEHITAQMAQTIQAEYAEIEPGLSIALQSLSEPPGQALTREDSERAIWLLMALPHGVAGMSPSIKEAVETSSNLAVANLKAGHLQVLSSQRSALTSRLAEITATINAIADLAGAEARDENRYPPWPPDFKANLLLAAEKVYRDLFARDASVQVIHAGLECAIIGDLYPGMQMISVGPTIESPHSPTERLHVPSVVKVRQFLAALLEAFARK